MSFQHQPFGPHFGHRFDGWAFADHVPAYIAEMVTAGYRPQSVQRAAKVVGDYVRWLLDVHGDGADLSEQTVQAFVAHSSNGGLIVNGKRAALVRMLATLRKAQVIASPERSRDRHDEVLAGFAAYLQDRRPTSSCREVFLRAETPKIAFPSAAGVILIARRALKRAKITGVAHRCSHVFRHSMATQMIRSGASLAEIGQILRHQDPDTARIYAKVDLPSLSLLGAVWPGSAQ